jgi:hypothetical protein
VGCCWLWWLCVCNSSQRQYVYEKAGLLGGYAHGVDGRPWQDVAGTQDAGCVKDRSGYGLY